MKKRILSTLLVLVLIVGLLPGTAWAADSDFTIENGVLIKYNGSGGDVTIPSSVTSIGEYAFQWCSNLTSISIPDGVTSIGNFAFNHCSSLISVNIPDGVTSIGKYAFGDCSSLTSVTIPSSVTSIEEYAFSNCRSLTSVSIPFGVTSIGERAFYKCTGLVSVTIPSSVTSIGIYVFEGCTSLTNVTIPFGITSIENGEFYWCSNLTSITIPPSITNIGGSAFSNCRSLTSVTIPSGITSIEAYTFNDCIGLTSMDIPSGVTSIGWWAFDGCTGLTSVNIPDSVTSIGNGAFRSCTGLKDVYYGGSEAQWKDIWINGSNECLTDATIHYNSAVPVPSTPSTPEGPSTNPTSPDGIQDTVQTNNYKVISLHDNSNTEIDFSYAVPTSGVTMLIFFRAESCSNSVYTLKSIAQSDWVKNSNLRIVLVETTGASKEAVQSFVDENLGTNQIYFFDILYRPHPSNSPPANSPYYLQFQYTKLVYSSNSVAWPFVILITEHQARNYIQFSDMGMRDAAYYGNALSTLLGTVDYTDTVNVTVAGTQYYNLASDVVKSVNTYRNQHGQTNLTWNKTLTEYAMQRAAEIALYYDHIRPNGESYNSIFDSQYGSYAWVGENIAWGQTGATEVMNSWMNSEGHRANILSANYTQIGVGCFTSRNTTYWVQLFGDSRTNTAQINSGDVKQANVTVSTLASHLNTHLTTDTSLTISSGETATVYFANTNSKSGKDTLLVPIVSDVKDKDNSSLTIATASVSANSQGTVTLSPRATGTGTVYFQAYEGDTNPATIMLNVEVGNNALAQEFVNTALAVKGKSVSHFGFDPELAWCGFFVGWCAQQNNLTGIISSNGANGVSHYKYVLNHGGTGVRFYDNREDMQQGNYFTDRNSYTPQVGDIVLFTWNYSYNSKREKISVPYGTYISHVGIVCGVSDRKVDVVHGNWGGVVAGPTAWDITSPEIYAYARPNWAAANTSTVGTRVDRYQCPISVRYEYNGEVLDSSSGQLSANFGTMILGNDESITVRLNSYCDANITITGTGIGTMDLTSTFQNNNGAIITKAFKDVPITQKSVIKLYTYDDSDTERLMIYTNSGKEFVEVWSVDTNNITSKANQELTDWLLGGDSDKLTSESNSTPMSFFTDVQNGAYYADAVAWAVEKGITVGTSATTFSPDANVTRGQAVTFLWRAMGMPSPKSVANPFSDVKFSDYYYEAVLWAVEQGITYGTSATSFSPNGNVTRGQMVAFLYRTVGEPGKTGTGAWYADAENWANRQGLLNGTAVAYTTNGDCPRSDVVYYLWKASDTYKITAEDSSGTVGSYGYTLSLSSNDIKKDANFRIYVDIDRSTSVASTVVLVCTNENGESFTFVLDPTTNDNVYLSASCYLTGNWTAYAKITYADGTIHDGASASNYIYWKVTE